MAKPEFEATWIPRIGEEAAEELRRGRKIAVIGVLIPVLSAAAGLLIGTGTVNDLIGAALASMAAGIVVAFLRAQRRIAAALSRWFGVKITGGRLPKMNPKRFDAWCQERGLRHSDEQIGSGEAAQSSDAAPQGSP
jgi:hypothetical protein